MITVTDRAKRRLKQVARKLRDSRRWPRLVVASRGAFGLVSDERRADDQVVEHDGSVILLVGRDVSGFVRDSVIDCEEAGGQVALVVRRAA